LSNTLKSSFPNFWCRFGKSSGRSYG